MLKTQGSIRTDKILLERDNYNHQMYVFTNSKLLLLVCEYRSKQLKTICNGSVNSMWGEMKIKAHIIWLGLVTVCNKFILPTILSCAIKKRRLSVLPNLQITNLLPLLNTNTNAYKNMNNNLLIVNGLPVFMTIVQHRFRVCWRAKLSVSLSTPGDFYKGT